MVLSNVIVDVYLFGYGTLTTHSPLYIKMKSTIFTNTLTDRTRTYSLPWIIERLDGKVADVIRSNIVEKYDAHYGEPLNLLPQVTQA